MHVFGVLDLQARYKGKTVHFDCLVVQDIGCNAFISWHDLYNSKIISLPCKSSCNACAVDTKLDDSLTVLKKKNYFAPIGYEI